MVMLDTDVLIAMLRGDATARQKVITYEDTGEHICISTITVFELLRGVQRGQHPLRDRERYAEITEKMYPIDFTYIEADVAAKIDAYLARSGIPIGEMDILIAATCLATGQTLATRNTKHFEKIPGLKLETW